MKTVPVERIKINLSNFSKSFLTPTCVSLANKRDAAFATGNDVLYQHFKLKCNDEIVKSKRIWANGLRAKSNNFWSIVKQISSKGNNNSGIFNVINNYKDILSCSEAISSSFATVFTPKDNIGIEEFLNNLKCNSYENNYWNINITVNTVKKRLSTS